VFEKAWKAPGAGKPECIRERSLSGGSNPLQVFPFYKTTVQADRKALKFGWN